ncbi:hypothetical protein BDY19DRAFT_888854 [Irpex rosettiformis]|uniref:Uncharacterized protein n=1 Tax=Irpex rosettiformis TaxID=378272 RepID=A0ACB8U653_9APHY|nr:hypothetical protein BDY19DRAFT_888854 [Irpex rosettiformis]
MTTTTTTVTVPDPAYVKPSTLSNGFLTLNPSTKHYDDPFDQLSGDLVETALAMLSKADIPLIPWGSLLYRSLGVPKVLLHYQFFVPDELLDLASSIISATHLPLTPPPPLLVDTVGDLITKGYLHRLTHATVPGAVQYLHLLPLSFAGFRTSELVEEHHPSYTLSVPRPSAVYACLLRIMASYPRRNSPVRGYLEAELELLVNYHLIDLQIGYLDSEDEESWDALGMDAKVENAACTVSSWGAAGEWRCGEEWMGDALVAIIRGNGDVGELPWTDQ